MLTVIELFNNQLYIFIAATIIIILIFVFVFIIIYSARKNNQFYQNAFTPNKNHNYTFQFDFEKDIIQIYRRTKTVEYCSYRFSEFREMVIEDQRSKFDEWIKHLSTTRDNASFAVKIDSLFGNNYRWLRFSYEHIRAARKIVYCSAYTTSEYRKEKHFSSDIININMFKVRIEENCANGKLEGIIYCVNCNMLDLIRRRYGIEVSNTYLSQVIHNFNELNKLNTLVGHFKDDKFLIYKESISKINLENDLNKILMSLNKNIEFDKNQFEIKMTFGVSILGKYSSNISEVINQAHKASLLSKGNLVVYDDNMFQTEQNHFSRIQKIRGLLDKAKFNANYYPIISLHNGNEFGYFSEMDLSLKDALNNLEVIGNETTDLKNRFFTVSVKTYLEKFIDNDLYHLGKLFISCDMEMLPLLEEVYLSKLDYGSVSLVAVINSYDQLLHKDVDKKVFESLRKNKITLGVVADEQLQTTFDPSLEYVSYVILPKEMIKTINIDQRMHMNVGNIVELMDNYSIQTIAADVNNISQAEVLKSLGVIYMNGPLFDSRSMDSNSKRKLVKLLDEN